MEANFNLSACDYCTHRLLHAYLKSMTFHYAPVAKQVIHEKQRISSAARFYDRCVQEYDRAYREPCAVHFQELNDL